eukprot:g2066.t1
MTDWGDDEKKALEEIIPKLSDGRRAVRIMAVDAVAGLTASDSGRRQLMDGGNSTDGEGPSAAEVLCGLLDDRHVAKSAISALTNLCCAGGEGDDRVATLLSEYGEAVPTLMRNALDPLCKAQAESVMLLANMSISECGARTLMQLDGAEAEHVAGALAGMWLTTLSRAFCGTGAAVSASGSGTESAEAIEVVGEGTPGNDVDAADTRALQQMESELELAHDPFEYISYVLANVSKSEDGRRLLLHSDSDGAEGSAAHDCILARVLPQLSSSNPIRRRGIATVLRNCCFDWSRQKWLVESLGIVSHVLVALVDGKDEFDEDDMDGMPVAVLSLPSTKRREPEAATRRTLIEVLLLLSWRAREVRELVKKQQVYAVVRNLHLDEPDERCGELIYELVEYLIRDEEGEEPDWNAIQAQSLSVSSEEQAAAAAAATAATRAGVDGSDGTEEDGGHGDDDCDAGAEELD